MGYYKQYCYDYEGEWRDLLRKSCPFLFLTTALLVLISTFWYMYYHPFHPPEVTVESASLARFNPGGRSNDSLPYELALNVSIALFRIDDFCFDAIEGRAYHGNQELGYACVPSAFCLPQFNQTFVSLTFSGWNWNGSTTAGGPAERVGWFVGVVKIYIRGTYTSYNFRDGFNFISTVRKDGMAECRVEVPLPSHGNSSAWLQRRTRCRGKFYGF